MSNLPPAPGNRVYQVWLHRPGRAPDPTDALFSVERHGHATVAVPGDLEGVEEVLVTAEPPGGSRVPTRTPILSARLT